MPAPYRNPWRILAEDLQAVGADLRLRLRQLWRRNREGELWHPPWWPGDLAPLFWPLCLAAAVAVLLALAMATGRRLPKPSPQLNLAAPAAQVSAETPLEPSQALGTEPIPAPPVATELPPTLPATLPAAVPPTSPPEAAASPDSDPLALLLASSDVAGLVAVASPDPAAGCLRLEVQPAFTGLPAPDRQHRAERWQALALELGYDHLELIDRGGRLLARDALVGGGMIMVSPAPST